MGNVGVKGAQVQLKDLQRPFIQRLCLGVVALLVVQDSEVAKTDGHLP